MNEQMEGSDADYDDDENDLDEDNRSGGAIL